MHGMHEVMGSIPVGSTEKRLFAQAAVNTPTPKADTPKLHGLSSEA